MKKSLMIQHVTHHSIKELNLSNNVQFREYLVSLDAHPRKNSKIRLGVPSVETLVLNTYYIK